MSIFYITTKNFDFKNFVRLKKKCLTGTNTFELRLTFQRLTGQRHPSRKTKSQIEGISES